MIEIWIGAGIVGVGIFGLCVIAFGLGIKFERGRTSAAQGMKLARASTFAGNKERKVTAPGSVTEEAPRPKKKSRRKIEHEVTEHAIDPMAAIEREAAGWMG